MNIVVGGFSVLEDKSHWRKEGSGNERLGFWKNIEITKNQNRNSIGENNS